MPRHPPCALTILTVIVDSRRCLAATPVYNGDLPLFGQLCSFQGPARAQPEGLPGWSLKTQQCTTRIWRVWPARTVPGNGLARCAAMPTPDLQARSTFRDAVRPEAGTTGLAVARLPRKE